MSLSSIKTIDQYERVLIQIEELMDKSPLDGTPEGDLLEVLTDLVYAYESRTVDIPVPDPIEAIKFRMEQGNLSHRDLIPLIGSRNKVSEILSGKRSLTLSMIRAISESLEIPAEILIRRPPIKHIETLNWAKFPINEMVKRNWLPELSFLSERESEQIISNFFSRIFAPEFSLENTLLRKSDTVITRGKFNPYYLTCWLARVINLASEIPPAFPFFHGNLSPDFFRELVQLSKFNDGPLRARHLLREIGVSLIVEKHLPRTHLDGAAILSVLDFPIIGLTIRHDRVDNFWFTLLHELGHLFLHSQSEIIQFFDDMEFDLHIDHYEVEADEFARETLVPQVEWSRSPAKILKNTDSINHTARKLNIHPAIIAGKIRFENKDYRLLSRNLGQDEVRILFPEVEW